MIILELTNDMNYFIPILLAVTISTGIGNVMNHSIYDAFLRNKGLPYLPFLRVEGDSIVVCRQRDRGDREGGRGRVINDYTDRHAIS